MAVRKTFEFKGQMINYYNKLKNDNGKNSVVKFEYINCGSDGKGGFYVEYKRK